MASVAKKTYKTSARLTWTFEDICGICSRARDATSGALAFRDLGFLSAEHKWSFKVSADTDKEGDPKHLGIWLRFTGKPADVKVKVFACTFEVFIPSSGTWKLVGGPFSQDLAPGVLLGTKSAVSYADLQATSSEYLDNGALNVRVDLDFEVGYSSQHHLGAHSLRMAQLYESAKYSDFTLVSSDGKEFQVHRSVLAVHSPVFLGMFEHDTAEQQTNRADIQDVDGETLDVMLRYIYSGETIKVAKVAEDVMKAAHKYDVHDLLDLTVKLLSVNMTFQNAFRLMTDADQRDLPELSSAAGQFMLYNRNTFRRTKENQQLKQESSLLWSYMETVCDHV